MEPIETHLSKSSRGRKPVCDSKASEYRDRITAWKLTPEGKRQPATLTLLATELGISKQLASYYARQVPGSVEELVDSAEREALGRYPRILNTLSDLAEKGSVEAIKVYVRELAGPRRPQQGKQGWGDNIQLVVAIQNLMGVQPKPVTVENGPERQIK
jgi:hypothetical protein